MISIRFHHQPHFKLGVLIAAGITFVALMNWIMPYEVIADEAFHLAQIAIFFGNDSYYIPQLAMPRLYHWIIGGTSQLFMVDSISGVRLISATYCYLLVILAWYYLERHKPAFPFIQALQLLTAPLLWPFFWVLYTDIPSLACIILGFLFVNKRQYRLAVLVSVMSLLFRQHNIFWVLLMWCIALGQESLWSRLAVILTEKNGGDSTTAFRTLDFLWRSIKPTAVFLVPVFLFITFLIWNQGIALGDKENQRFGGIYPLQVFFFLLIFAVMALPLHLANLSKICNLLLKSLWPWVILITLFLLYMTTFKIVHPHNFPSDYFLRNALLYYLQDHFRYKVLAFGLIALSMTSLIVTSLRFSSGYWLYPITLLALLPTSLIEQRYYMVPFCLFMLWRYPQKKCVEVALLVWFAAISAALTWGMVNMRFFL